MTGWLLIGAVVVGYGSLGLWLTFKGFKSSAPIMVAAAAQSGSPDGPAVVVLDPRSRTEAAAASV